jgi:hypothetical protein
VKKANSRMQNVNIPPLNPQFKQSFLQHLNDNSSEINRVIDPQEDNGINEEMKGMPKFNLYNICRLI